MPAPVDAERLRNAYKSSLNRDASDEEIAGWTSGKFGGGNINDWERQIAGSHEAQQRAPARAPLSNQANAGAGYQQQTPPQNSWDQFANDNRAVGDRQELLKNAYKRWTGRDADEAGLAAHMKNPYGTEGALRSIYESDESKAYSQANPDAWAGHQPISPAAPPPVDPNAPAAYDPAAVQPQQFDRFVPKYAMEVFPVDRAYDTGKSAKDAFAVLSNNAPPPPTEDKAALGEWFKKNVAPGMNALGHKIISVEGDKFTFENWQGRFTVDFGRGAGAANGALAWQVDENTAQMGNGPYVPQQRQAPGAAPPATTPPPADPAAPPPVDPNLTPQVDPNDPNAPVVNQALSNSTNYRRRRQYQRFQQAQQQAQAPKAQPSI